MRVVPCDGEPGTGEQAGVRVPTFTGGIAGLSIEMIGPPTYGSNIVAKIAPDYLVPFNRQHFTDDPGVPMRSPELIGTPGEVLAWVWEQLAP